MKVMTKEFRVVQEQDWWDKHFKEIGGKARLCAEAVEDLFEIPEKTTRILVTLRTDQTENAYPIRPSQRQTVWDDSSVPEHELLWEDERGRIEPVGFDYGTDKLIQEAFKKANRAKVLWATVDVLY